MHRNQLLWTAKIGCNNPGRNVWRNAILAIFLNRETIVVESRKMGSMSYLGLIQFSFFTSRVVALHWLGLLGSLFQQILDYVCYRFNAWKQNSYHSNTRSILSAPPLFAHECQLRIHCSRIWETCSSWFLRLSWPGFSLYFRSPPLKTATWP